jgi:adenylate cyclase
VLRSLGRGDEGIPYLRMGVKRAEEELRLHPESSRPAQLGACALAQLGEKEKALKWLERVMIIDPNDNGARYNAACTYALLGEHDQAIDLLYDWVKDAGPEQKNWFMHDADLDLIRDAPRYPELAKQVERIAVSPITA